MTESTKKYSMLFLDIFQRNRKSILTSAKIFIAAGLIIYLISYVNFNEIVLALKNANGYLIAAAFLLGILNVYLQFYKWKITVWALLGEKSDQEILLSLFYGFSAGVFTPARVGEYFGRALVFKDNTLFRVTAATLIDKLFLLLIVLFIGSVASVLYVHFFYNATFYITTALLIVIFALFYFFTLLIFSEKFWNKIIFERLRESGKLSGLLEKAAVFQRLDKYYSVKMILISVLFYLCFIVQYSLLVAAFSGNENFTGYIWAGNLVMFSKTIIPPVSLGEIGIREGASVFFITQFGEKASAGFNASIFLFLINVLIPSLIGMILLLKKNND